MFVCYLRVSLATRITTDGEAVRVDPSGQGEDRLHY